MTMQKMKVKYREVSSPCAKCGKIAIESPVEILPKDGVLMRAIHEDGTEHRWAEYSSMFVGRDRKERIDTTRIRCPCILVKGPRKGEICGKIGRVNPYHPDIKNHPEVIEYQIVPWENKRQMGN